MGKWVLKIVVQFNSNLPPNATVVESQIPWYCRILGFLKLIYGVDCLVLFSTQCFGNLEKKRNSIILSMPEEANEPDRHLQNIHVNWTLYTMAIDNISYLPDKCAWSEWLIWNTSQLCEYDINKRCNVVRS